MIHSPSAERYLAFVAACFAVGGAAIAVASVWSAQPRKLFLLYALEFAQVGAVLAPALLGSPGIELAYIAIGGACTYELARCLRAAGSAHGGAWAVLVVATAVCALSLVARRSFGELALLYALIEINDTVAWAVGSAVGRHRLWPTLSPNKTWEGLVGGAAGSVGAALCLRFLAPTWPTAAIIGAGVVMATAGTTGDLLASYAKRRAGLRNYAAWIPYQGGVLDLYDSLLFAAPVWLLYERIVDAFA